ncbi:hypothetical protein [Aureibacillus halotolerans]|uniref:hypothetical protein n=1 Tax=Aureibacillus halotolerans TaxID=1508390 RepID=UPI00105C3F65|nr:hypothetical protein [Aureibacillus halotolerans]
MFFLILNVIGPADQPIQWTSGGLLSILLLTFLASTITYGLRSFRKQQVSRLLTGVAIIISLCIPPIAFFYSLGRPKELSEVQHFLNGLSAGDFVPYLLIAMIASVFLWWGHFFRQAKREQCPNNHFLS